MDSAVIFDVDGVLLDLTPAEEDAFFAPFRSRYGLTGLSRDWDSYRVRNDVAIIAEILEHHGLPAGDHAAIVNDYLNLLGEGLRTGALLAATVAGAEALLRDLAGRHRLGIATANLREAARLRLDASGLWSAVSGLAFGAEVGGPKRETLAHAIAVTGLPKHRIVYVGDNLNDVDAGLANGVHFIGFAESAERRASLAVAGARHLAADHATTRRLIAGFLT